MFSVQRLFMQTEQTALHLRPLNQKVVLKTGGGSREVDHCCSAGIVGGDKCRRSR